VEGKLYCEPCSLRADVNWLEAYRLSLWGKRDGWAWLIGLGSVLNVALFVVGLVSTNPVLIVQGAFAAAVSVCFWLGQPWARYGLVASSVLSVLVILGQGGDPEQVGQALGRVLIPFLITLYIVFGDTRNKLFFKIAVPEAKLRKLWETFANNVVARYGFLLGLLGLLLPPLGLIGLILSIIGLRRVDPNARPPIGRKGYAIAGIALGGLGTTWGLVLVGSILFRALSR